MEQPHIYKLIDMLQSYTLISQSIPIKDHQYVCGYVIPKQKLIIFNKNNPYKINLETLAHETIHIYYHNKNITVTEDYVEQLSKQYLNLYPEYYEELEDKLSELK